MGIFLPEQGEDRNTRIWRPPVDAKGQTTLLPLEFQRPEMVDRPVMTNRRFSWMDQIGTARRPSRNDPQTPGETSHPPSWGHPSPSGLRATAAIWTPVATSEADEYAVETEVTEDLESKFAATTIGEAGHSRTSSTAGSSDSRHTQSPFGISRTPEGFHNPYFHTRKDSNLSESTRNLPEDPRGRNSLASTPQPKRVDSVGAPSAILANSPYAETATLTPSISAPASTQVKRGGLPELRTTALSDFRLEDVRGPLVTDDSMYAVVEFKLFRSEVYQLRRDWMGGTEGVCLVIVEADRGVDLGKVHHIGTDPDTAREMKRNLNRRHWSALLQNSATSKPSDEESEIAFKQVYEWTASSPFAGGFTAGDGTMPPRSIVRRANRTEISQLQFKEGLEERARRVCWQKAKEHGFTMEILAAEFQFDHQKLTFYFLAPGYVAFNPLINELYKIFKTRIWFVPLNPASFVNPSPSTLGHAPSSSGGSQSETFPASPQGQGRAKTNRRDARFPPVQTSPYANTQPPRVNIAVGAGRRGQPTTPQSSPWNTGPNRTGMNNDWPSQFSPHGFNSPRGGQGPWT